MPTKYEQYQAARKSGGPCAICSRRAVSPKGKLTQVNVTQFLGQRNLFLIQIFVHKDGPVLALGYAPEGTMRSRAASSI
jgi:hypothetical protein